MSIEEKSRKDLHGSSMLQQNLEQEKANLQHRQHCWREVIAGF